MRFFEMPIKYESSSQRSLPLLKLYFQWAIHLLDGTRIESDFTKLGYISDASEMPKPSWTATELKHRDDISKLTITARDIERDIIFPLAEFDAGEFSKVSYLMAGYPSQCVVGIVIWLPDGSKKEFLRDGITYLRREN